MSVMPARRNVVLLGLVLCTATLPFSIALSQIGYGLALLAWGVPIALGRARRPRRTPLDWYLLAYLAAELLSFAFSEDRAANLLYMRRMLLVPLYYLIAESIESERDFMWLLQPMLAVSAILSLHGIAIYLTGPGGLDGRIRLFNHYMTTAGILMIVTLYGLAHSLPLRAPARRWIPVATLVCCVCLVFTFTRSSWLGFLAGCILIAAYAQWQLLPLMAVAAVAAHLALHGDLASRLASIVDPSHPNNRERTYMWRAAVRIIHDHPWTGIGDIDTTPIYLRYRLPQAQEVHGHFHDNLLQIGVTLGVPGMLAVGALFVRALILLWNNLRRARLGAAWQRRAAVSALAIFVAFQVNGLFDWNFGDAEIAMLLWMTLGVSEAARRAGA